MYDEPSESVKAMALVIAIIVLIVLGFVIGHAVGQTQEQDRQKIERGVEHHAKHTEYKAVMRGIKLLICKQCGIVFDPAEAGGVITEENWEKLWRWTDK